MARPMREQGIDGVPIKIRDMVWRIPYRRPNGKPSNRYFVEGICSICGKEFLRHASNAKKSSMACCSRLCQTALFKDVYAKSSIVGVKWHNGHKLIYLPDHPKAKKNYVFEHRVVIEKKLGIVLADKDVVHHINMNKSDNSPDNLDVFKTPKDHFKCHGTLNKCVEYLILSGTLMYDRKKQEYFCKEGL